MNTKIELHTNRLNAAQTIIEEALRRLVEIRTIEQLTEFEVNVLTMRYIQDRNDAEKKAEFCSRWIKEYTSDETLDEAMLERMTERLADLLLGERLPLDMHDGQHCFYLTMNEVTKVHCREMAEAWCRNSLHIDPSPIRNKVWQVLERCLNQHNQMANA